MLCNCGSQKEYVLCCEPYLTGAAHPLTAEALMRSRYSAFERCLVPYIMGTVHPDKRDAHDPSGIEEWAKSSEWQGLEIVRTADGGVDDDEGIVEFIARFRTKDAPRKHHEIAVFRKHEERWYFFDGAPPKAQTVVRDSPKVGRNDPCPCGSGRKYKKCCAKSA